MGGRLTGQILCLNRDFGNRKFKSYYTLGPKIGTGACAHVRICYHIPTSQKHVVKIISKPYSKEDFKLEIDIFKQICAKECPYVVEFMDWFEDNRYFYSVMEYCSGGELFSVLKKGGKTTEAMLAEWFRQILEGISHIHLLGIVHRDIKPQNFVFSDETAAIIKIIDFGLSFRMKKGELLHEPCGTAEYLSPEMVLGRYGRKVDIWSLGVVCFLTLFGRRPFVALTDAELFRKIVESEPDYTVGNNSVYNPSAEAVSFCKMLLTKNFRARPTAVDALQHVWLNRARGCPSLTQNVDAVEIPQGIREHACKEGLYIEEREKLRLERVSRLASQSSQPSSACCIKGSRVLGVFHKEDALKLKCFPSLFHQEDSKIMISKDSDKRCTRVNVMQYSSLLNDIKRLRETEILGDSVDSENKST